MSGVEWNMITLKIVGQLLRSSKLKIPVTNRYKNINFGLVLMI